MSFEKFNRIAVVLVGNYRTFRSLNNHYLIFFNNMAHKVDYYLYIWDNDPKLNFSLDVSPYFGSHLKKYEIVDSNECPSRNKIYRLSYLALKAQQAKLQTESDENFIYDYVIETRPDLLLHPSFIDGNRFQTFANLSENEIVIDSSVVWEDAVHFRPWRPTDNIDSFKTNNWYFRMRSELYDQFSNRCSFYKDFKYENFHKDLYPYFVSNPHFIHTLHKDALYTEAVAPRDIRQGKLNIGIFW